MQWTSFAAHLSAAETYNKHGTNTTTTAFLVKRRDLHEFQFTIHVMSICGTRVMSVVQPYSHTAIQPYSRTAVQPYSRTAVQPYSRTVIQP